MTETDGLSEQELRFCEAVLQGQSTFEAYLAAHPSGTYNPASIRSLASRYRRRPNVAAYIRDGLRAIREGAVEAGIWGRVQSLLERRALLDSIKADVAERQARLADAVQMIMDDDSLSPGERGRAIAAAVARPVFGKGTVDSIKAVCDSLDGLSFGTDGKDWWEYDGLPANSPEKVAERKARDAEIEAQTIQDLSRQLPRIFGGAQ